MRSLDLALIGVLVAGDDRDDDYLTGFVNGVNDPVFPQAVSVEPLEVTP